MSGPFLFGGAPAQSALAAARSQDVVTRVAWSRPVQSLDEPTADLIDPGLYLLQFVFGREVGIQRGNRYPTGFDRVKVGTRTRVL